MPKALFPRTFRLPIIASLLAILLTAVVHAQTLNIANDVQTAATLTNTTVTMTGRSELHITGTGDPLPGCVIHLNSQDAWLFIRNLRPSVVNSTLLGRLRVNGANAVLNSNVRVVQYELGTVVIPHGPVFTPLQIFDGTHFTGPSKSLGLYTYYNEANLGILSAATSSFKLKRGYMATVAQQNTGMGSSKVYIAQDGDLEISVLPAALNNNIRYVRVFPWRWVSKKGWGGGLGNNMNHLWSYDWGAEANSAGLDSEYVPIRHGRYWPGFDVINAKQNVTHLLGFNEPDHAEQANMSVDDAVAMWPELMKSGLRLGSPAVTDGGLNWLYSFIDRCDQLGYRVDFVAVHFYRANYSYWQLHEMLREISERTKRPIWITEFNNGAQWTDNQGVPTLAQNATRIGEFIDMMGWAGFVERYAIFNWVGDTRRMVEDNGNLTPAGVIYRDKVSPLAQVQEIPETATPVNASFLFEGNAQDTSGNGHNGMVMGSPGYVAGKSGQAMSFDGASDYVRLSPKLGDSTDFSFTGWVFWNGGGNWQRIFDLGSGTDNFVALVPKTGDTSKLRFVMKNGAAGGEQKLDSPAALPTGVWTHVAVTLAGDTGKIFVNGALTATSTTMTINPGSVGTLWNYLGKAQFAADPLFNGRMDDVRFFNSALSDAQVAAIYNNVAPQFTANPLVKSDAVKLQPYSGSLMENATDANPGTVLTFSKLAGPVWLNVAPDGKFTGIPLLGDTGINSFQIKATDPAGASAVTTLSITVLDLPVTEQRYAFDGNANASAGIANGVTTGSSAYAVGKAGQAIDLDGTDDFVTLPPDVASSTDITLAAWVNWDGGAGWQRIFDFGSGTADNLFLTPSSGGTPRTVFAIKNGGAEQVLDAPPLATGVWTHVAVTLEGNTGKLFINGAVVDTDTVTINPSDIRAASNYLGKSQWPDPLYNGRIDEFHLYNRALTTTQVTELMNNRAPRFLSDPLSRPAATAGQPYYHTLRGAATEPDSGDTITYSKVSGPAWLNVAANGRLSGTPDAGNTGSNRFIIRVSDNHMASDDAVLSLSVTGASGLVASYELNGNLNDLAGAQTGTPGGGPLFGDGRHDRALIFDGVNDFVTLPTGVANHAAITIATRFRWSGAGANWQRVFDFGNNTNQYLFLAPNGGGTMRFAIKNGGAEQILEAPAPAPGEWVHVAVTLGANTGRLYVNGALAASAAITITPDSFNPTLNYLGDSQYVADPFFNGVIDDLRIYNRVLSAAEVFQLAIQNYGILGSGIVPLDTPFAAWKFEHAFDLGTDGPGDDPDGDGVVNLLEYLFDSNPLVAGTNLLPQGEIKAGALLGMSEAADKHYLSFQARVRKDRAAVSLMPQAAATIEGLSTPEAAGNVIQAGPPVTDGAFDVFTYYYPVAVEDSPDGKGFMRLTVVPD